MAKESPKNAEELRDSLEVCVRGSRGAPLDYESSSDESEEYAKENDVTVELREATESVAIQAGGGRPAAAHVPKRRVPTQHVESKTKNAGIALPKGDRARAREKAEQWAGQATRRRLRKLSTDYHRMRQESRKNEERRRGIRMTLAEAPTPHSQVQRSNAENGTINKERKRERKREGKNRVFFLRLHLPRYKCKVVL